MASLDIHAALATDTNLGLLAPDLLESAAPEIVPSTPADLASPVVSNDSNLVTEILRWRRNMGSDALWSLFDPIKDTADGDAWSAVIQVG